MPVAIPKTPYVYLSGSAGWGIRFPDDLAEPNVRVLERWLAFETPWGVSENWQVLEVDGGLTPDGRPRIILNVFSHGWPNDAIDHAAHQRVAWYRHRVGHALARDGPVVLRRDRTGLRRAVDGDGGGG